MARPFRFYPFFGVDGSILLADCGTRAATESDMDRFYRKAEPELDRLTMEMCAHERAHGNRLDPWQLEAETASFLRLRAGLH